VVSPGERMRHNARTLADRGHLRTGLTLDQATDILWTYSSRDFVSPRR
jgi:hypothetical protein